MLQYEILLYVLLKKLIQTETLKRKKLLKQLLLEQVKKLEEKMEVISDLMTMQ
jgi:hypothetical protein